jgi:hypothetical protein
MFLAHIKNPAFERPLSGRNNAYTFSRCRMDKARFAKLSAPRESALDGFSDPARTCELRVLPISARHRALEASAQEKDSKHAFSPIPPDQK